jgi:hypothetical protein
MKNAVMHERYYIGDPFISSAQLAARVQELHPVISVYIALVDR